MKAVIISDPHAHKYRAFNNGGQRLSNVIDAIEQAWDLAAKQAVGADTGINPDMYYGLLIIPGDIFNNHQTVATDAMVELVKLFTRKSTQYPNVDVVIISGNHDQSTKNMYDAPAVSAVHALAELSDNVHCIDNGSYSGDDFHIFGVPYYPDTDDLRKAIDAASTKAKSVQADKGGPIYLLMHQTVGFGIEMVPDDINPKDPLFTPFDLVFNGHIHDHSFVTDTFINVGTPLHRDAGDVGKDKGVLILDTDTNKVERVLFNYPQYRKLDEGKEIPEEWKDDYIMWIPKQIEVKLEEQEIQEKFDHNKVTREGMIENYIKIKLSSFEPDKVNGKAIRSYGKKLLDYAD